MREIYIFKISQSKENSRKLKLIGLHLLPSSGKKSSASTNFFHESLKNVLTNDRVSWLNFFNREPVQIYEESLFSFLCFYRHFLQCLCNRNLEFQHLLRKYFFFWNDVFLFSIKMYPGWFKMEIMTIIS